MQGGTIKINSLEFLAQVKGVYTQNSRWAEFQCS